MWPPAKGGVCARLPFVFGGVVCLDELREVLVDLERLEITEEEEPPVEPFSQLDPDTDPVALASVV